MPRGGNIAVDGLARALGYPFFALAHRFRWLGARNVPRLGPAILAANHQSFYDPVLVGIAAGRHVTFLAWDYYCRKLVLGGLMRLAGVVPVDVDSPGARVMARLLRVLDRGGVCGIFPEGGRTPDGLPLEAQPGVALLAMRSGAPVIPVTIHGAQSAWPKGCRLPRPGRISLRFGPAMHAPAQDEGPGDQKGRRAEFTLRLMLAIADGFAELGAPEVTEAWRRRLLAREVIE